MKTLAEIEAAVLALPPAEMEALERRLHELNSARRERRKVFTGWDAMRWWREREHMPLGEGELFAQDVESARSEVVPPTAPRWV